MLFLIDAQLPPGLKRRLAEAGHDSAHVFDVLPADAPDAAVAAEAERLGAVLLTKDEDFMDMARRGVLMSPLVWIRSGNMTTDRLWQLLAPVLPDIEAAVAGGETVIEVR